MFDLDGAVALGFVPPFRSIELALGNLNRSLLRGQAFPPIPNRLLHARLGHLAQIAVILRQRRRAILPVISTRQIVRFVFVYDVMEVRPETTMKLRLEGSVKAKMLEQCDVAFTVQAASMPSI